MKTCCSLMQSISSMVALVHLVWLFCLSNSQASLYHLGMRYPNMYLFALLACLILDCMTALVRVLSLFARFLNLFQPSMCRRSFPLYMWHMLQGHLLPGLRQVHRSSPQSPTLQGHYTRILSNWDLLA